MITKLIRVATEKLTSVEDDMLYYQGGTVASALNASSTFLPCSMNKPLAVVLTPVYDVDDANGTALGAWEVESLENLATVSNLPAYTSGVNYKVDQLVRYNDDAYICLEAHTSTATFDPSKWKKLNAKTFVKINHNAAGSNKLVKVSYLVFGYDL